jgi:integrase
MRETKRNGRVKVTLDRGRDAAGNRVRLVRSFDTDDEADAWERKVTGRPLAGDGRTVADAVALYLDVHYDRLAPSTYNGYASQRNRYLDGTAFGSTDLDDVDELAVEAFYRSLFRGTWGKDGSRLATNTVRNVHRLLSVAFDEARRSRWITTNPAADARYAFGEAAPAPRSDSFFELDEVAKVLDAGDRDLADLVHVSFTTGCREGELAAVRVSDLRLDGAVPEVLIHATVTRPKGDPLAPWIRKNRTKSGAPRRVPLDPETVDTLRARLTRLRAQGLRAGVTDLADVAVFSRALERGLTNPAELGARWRRAARKAGSTMRFHDLRHVNTTEQLDAGVPDHAIAARNGWSGTQMIGRYGHARRRNDERSTSAVSAAWRRVGEARGA